MKRVGIDIGRVIISGGNEGVDFFSKNYLKVPEVPFASRSVAKIVQEYGAHNVFLISKCSEAIQHKTLEWLEVQNFFNTMHIYRHQVLFCRNRDEKAQIVKEHAIDTFIDDRFAVLKHMLFLKELYLFNPSADEQAEALNCPAASHVHTITHWDDLLSLLIK